MAKGNGKKMEAKQFTISEELNPNRVEKKKQQLKAHKNELEIKSNLISSLFKITKGSLSLQSFTADPKLPA